MWNSPRGRVVLAVSVLACVGVAYFAYRLVRPSYSTVVHEVRTAMQRGNQSAAMHWTSMLVERWPDNPEHWAMRAFAASRANQKAVWKDAVERVEKTNPEIAVELWIGVGTSEMQQGHAADAEFCLRRATAIQRSRPEPWRLMAQLLAVQGRPADTAECLLQMIRLGDFSSEDLHTLAWPNSAVSDMKRVETLLKEDPENLVPLLAFVGAALNVNASADGERIVADILKKHPEQPRANAILGWLLANRDAPEFADWIREKAKLTEGEVEGWLAKGIWLRRRGRDSAATAMFRKAQEVDPRHVIAASELGLSLRALGETELADAMLDWSRRQQEITELAKRIIERADQKDMRSLIVAFEEVGRAWEAWGWCRAFTHAYPDDAWGKENLPRLRKLVSNDPPRTLPGALPGAGFAWNKLDEPDWTPAPTTGSKNSATPATDDGGPAFVDEASQRGLDFHYVNGVPGRRTILQTSGGGSAAFDFDRDGWCDLYFTQGGSDPARPAQAELDILYRNDRGERFQAITESAGVREDGFSQGVSAGDLDGDGFADLFVANHGRNRLFRNQGDGTFLDITEAAGLMSTGWTTCVAIADIDADGDADLFLSRYAGGPEVATRECTDREGKPGVCRPTLFPAEGDLLAVGSGDGRFTELSADAGLNDVDGRGFGLVVDDFNDDGKMDVFVANDQTANFLWMQHDAKDGHPMFVDEAVSLGTAFDRDGFPQACMGVASGDVNGDGRTDLYLTNFQDESNTLYLSQSRGGFEDRTRDAELRDPSFPYLGFGTQFVDADLDGRLDLIVLNGHILDQSEIGRPAALRPQVFQQLAGGRFREMSAWSPTDFLGRPRIGRGLTLIDWNRDGLTDFAASYLDGTAGLGTNRTERPGRWLEIELAGVTTARDAIGAKVRFQFADGTERVARLTAGDGFAASNERVIRTGLGIADETVAKAAVSELTIEWPSGAKDRHTEVPANARWLAVEGRPSLTKVR